MPDDAVGSFRGGLFVDMAVPDLPAACSFADLPELGLLRVIIFRGTGVMADEMPANNVVRSDIRKAAGSVEAYRLGIMVALYQKAGAL